MHIKQVSLPKNWNAQDPEMLALSFPYSGVSQVFYGLYKKIHYYITRRNIWNMQLEYTRFNHIQSRPYENNEMFYAENPVQ